MKIYQLKNIIAGLVCLCAAHKTAFAGPLREAVKEAGGAVEYVGKTAGDTAKAVGKSVSNTADRITGDFDPSAARREVDSMEAESMARLLKLDSKARALFEISYGYAVFDSRKTSFIVTVGRGAGVAVVRDGGKRVYMQMASAGANLGGGIKFYQNIFLFENKSAFERFVEHGWEAGTSGGASLGRKSLDADVRFTDGMAVFQLSETGAMLSADLTGTKYWKDGKLNG